MSWKENLWSNGPWANCGNMGSSEMIRNFHSTIKRAGLQEIIKERQALSKIGFDLGSGKGESTLTLMHLFPEIKTICTVDANYRNPSGLATNFDGKIIHHESMILDFLKNIKTKADVIMIASVPSHQLKSVEDYGLLKKRLSHGGLILQIGDTELQDIPMNNQFKQLVSAEDPGFGGSIWMNV